MKFARTLFLAALVLLSLDAAAQAVGRVLIAAGEVVATRAGRDVPLATGATIEKGDLIRTGEASSAQLRFADESIVAMRAKSQFEVTEYNFTGKDDGISNVAFNLVSGGMRTLTGLIGKVYKDRYRTRTPLASIGIRGTTYTLVQCRQDCLNDDGSVAADGTYGTVFDGRVVVANPVGAREFAIDEVFFVANLSTPPQALLSRPSFLRDRLEAGAGRWPPSTAGAGPLSSSTGIAASSSVSFSTGDSNQATVTAPSFPRAEASAATAERCGVGGDRERRSQRTASPERLRRACISSSAISRPRRCSPGWCPRRRQRCATTT